MGKLVSNIRVKSNVDFFQVFKIPTHVPDVVPEIIQSVDLLHGQWGTVGSIILWNYIIDGKTYRAKEVIEAIDEEKKSMTYKVIEGDVLDIYSTFKISAEVEANGEDKMVRWTVEYEKKSEAVPDPHAIMLALVQMCKQIGGKYNYLVPN